MLVLVKVSSMNTSRERSIRPRYLVHCARRRATSGRSCSAAISVFFVTELFGVEVIPHRPVVDLQATLGEFSHQPADREIRPPAPLHQPLTMASRDLFGPVTTDLVRFNAARPAKALHPENCCADPHPSAAA